MQVWKNRVECAARIVVLFGYVFGLAAPWLRNKPPVRSCRTVRAPTLAKSQPLGFPQSASPQSQSSPEAASSQDQNAPPPAIPGAARSTKAGRNRGCGAYACRRHCRVATRGRGHCPRQATPDAHHRDQDRRDHRSGCCRRSGGRSDRSYWQ